jgi:predicted RNA-binding Zn-ribbon protein involved in translation (DUF1610 family)
VDDEARITQALRRRGTTMLCPACRFVLRGPVGSYRLIPDADTPGDSLGGSQGIRVMVYGCSNCGYIRLHSANVLTQADR